jgi:hypothetical protein
MLLKIVIIELACRYKTGFGTMAVVGMSLKIRFEANIANLEANI